MSASPLPNDPPTKISWFDAEDAPARFDLETCIHCGLCLTACPTYRELKTEPDSPRGRLYLMRGLSEGRIAPSDPLLGHLDLCLGCRACEPVCPAGVPYGRLLEATRAQLTRRVPSSGLGRWIGTWALGAIVPSRERMHAVADLLSLGQRGPIQAFMRSRLARRWLPDFATRGFAMTPPIEPRRERALERVASDLPRGAWMEERGDSLVFHPDGAPRARVAFFTTCVMDVLFPRLNHQAVRLLVLAGCEVAVPRAQTCCGALQAHAGLRRLSKDLARRNVHAFGDGADFIVTDSAGCGATLRDVGHLLEDDDAATRAERFAVRVRDIAEVLSLLGLPEQTARLASEHDRERPLRVAYHDPCHLAHGQRVRAEPRALLARLHGIELVDLPNSDWCCGSAGVYNLAHPEMAEAQLEGKLDSMAVANAELVVASNPGCMLHMARGAAGRGLDTRVVHLVEVLARAYPPPNAEPVPSHAASSAAHPEH